jgi:hypothetical protein
VKKGMRSRPHSSRPQRKTSGSSPASRGPDCIIGAGVGIWFRA